MTLPFAAFSSEIPFRSPLRQTITDHIEPPAAACIMELSSQATLPPEKAAQTREIARRLVRALRSGKKDNLIQSLVREYDLSSREGVALMCLAEALLRIPDNATRDALIRDKLTDGAWAAHLGGDSSVFVNVATWGLMFSGKILAVPEREGLGGTLTRLVERCGEPVIRRGVDVAMRMMGQQFVSGETIEGALENSRPYNRKGFRYSYDMLGEAAMTAEDAARYYRDYEQAIHAIGRASDGQGVYLGPGISVKLSAIHPRYSRFQRDRVLKELLPRLSDLAALAAQYDIGFSIDAEEVDRLELSLDLLEHLAFDERLADWDGLGFVVQAYQKRAPYVLDYVIDLARRAGRRIMVRLVKGAYWDTEVKRAQVDGAADFPVYTVKAHTDVSYIACARKLLAAPDAVFPQFATHNAQTLATIYTIAGPDFSDTRYEFQCLHGMGEKLYSEVVGPDRLGRPVRVYAPVGTHETLLAYLVRRLLENGANSSFVNRIQDPSVSIRDLIADPLTQATPQDTHPGVVMPRDLYGAERQNSAGIHLWNETVLRELAVSLPALTVPDVAVGEEIRNPSDRADRVGCVSFATAADVERSLAVAGEAFPEWKAEAPSRRAEILSRAADLLEERQNDFMALLVREAGKTLGNAVSEVREAVDFLRYYAAEVKSGFDNGTHVPLGPVVCISPWNFPLAIFLGQVAAALAAGNVVLAKPAEETPLIAVMAVALMHEAGIPENVLQILPGAGDIGAQLTADPRVCGVLFTGSTAVARMIRNELSNRLNPDGSAVPLIAETGGMNAMIVDSSALTEQVVTDVLASAFDSAGQRCSALRLLCVQEDSASTVLTMLKGAMCELRMGNPEHLNVDVGPVITEDARKMIEAHIASMKAQGCEIFQGPVDPACDAGTFVPPTLIVLKDISQLKQEIFGPVLHVVRYQRDRLTAMIHSINASGYALTFGLHTRIDNVVEYVSDTIEAGNIYINRNIVGAVVGTQPFGGHGLSGTGPKAGGPLYLYRLLAEHRAIAGDLAHPVSHETHIFRKWQNIAGRNVALSQLKKTLPGPSGESNIYQIMPRGHVLCAGPEMPHVLAQIDVALASGNCAVVPSALFAGLGQIPDSLSGVIVKDSPSVSYDVVLIDGDPLQRLEMQKAIAERSGPLLPVIMPSAGGEYPEEMLVVEKSVSTNTMAAGGNVALMSF